jgi:glycosyltransferase involved in cell wall biosynthesis
MARPLVSIVVPSYNQGRYIRETIDSILTQDYRPLEVLVIDGASTDETLDVLRSYADRPELRWWSESDAGVVDAVNKGLTRASGEIVAIQSSDDVYVPGAVAAAVEAFADGVVLVYGDCEYIDAASKVTGRTNLPPFDLAAYVGKRTFIPQASAFFTRASLAGTGGWRTDISYAADAEFFLRIAAQGPVVKLDAILARYRYHEEQRDRAGERIARDWEKAVTRWLVETGAPRALQRSAASGVHLTRAHYMTDALWPARTRELYRAALRRPSLVLDADFPRRELIPGRTPIWRALSRVKRALRRSKVRAGAAVYDLPRYWRHRGRGEWIHLRNRNETITTDGRGVRCDWEFSSDLHLANVFPRFGASVMRQAFNQWPIVLRDRPAEAGEPRVTFIIGHRGVERLPHLLMTLRSIAGQTDAAVECIVVEQSAGPEIASSLPDWVRYLHTPSADDYNRAWTFNAGVDAARGEIVILHDNDTPAPAGYAAECLACAAEGWDFLELKRFLFYLGEDETRRVFETRDVRNAAPSSVVQNLLGGSIAARRNAYLAIGGFDQSFVGWGGEDNEFWERVEVGGKAYRFGYLPFLHLYHAPQKGKIEGIEAPGVKRYYELRSIPPRERIARLLGKRG